MSDPKNQIAPIIEQNVDAGIPEESHGCIGPKDRSQKSPPGFGDVASSDWPRVCLYARDNTKKVGEGSLDGQLQAARERAAGERWRIVAQHIDSCVSGTTPIALRPGGKMLLADALAHGFDILIVESLDRLSRDVRDVSAMIGRFKRLGIQIIGTSDGYDSNAQGKDSMRISPGLVNELYLEELRDKTHRGLAHSFGRGYHIGGIPYGYASHPAPDGQGRHLRIDPAKARTVTRIFTDFAAGETALGIAQALNDEGEPGPRGRAWTGSALVGNSKRGTGLLNTEIYVGRLTWNRRVWRKDPVIGTRRGVDRPRSEWLLHDSPDLRILSAQLWESARRSAGLGEIL